MSNLLLFENSIQFEVVWTDRVLSTVAMSVFIVYESVTLNNATIYQENGQICVITLH